MIKLKQTITACLLSAILVSAIALPAFALDESVDQPPVVVDEQVEENSDTGGTQDEPVDTPADEPVDTPVDEPTDELTDESETSVVSDTSTDESEDTSSTPESKQESRKEDSEEESNSQGSKKIKTGKQNITFNVDFNCGLVSATKFLGTVDISNVKFTLLSADKKNIIKQVDISKGLNEAKYVGNLEVTTEVPDWGNHTTKQINQRTSHQQ